MDKEIQELLAKLLENPFYVKSSKGNLLSVVKKDGKWYAQGNEVKRQSDIDYLEKEAEKNLKDIEKTYNRLLDDLEYELWDSGQLSIDEKQILEYLLEKGIVTRKEGVAGEHETANGTAKWIYTLKDSIKEEQEDDAQKHRLRNKKKSNATKLAWKRKHGNYMRGVRERERKEAKSFYKALKEKEEIKMDIKKLNESITEALAELESGIDVSGDTVEFGLKKDEYDNYILTNGDKVIKLGTIYEETPDEVEIAVREELNDMMIYEWEDEKGVKSYDIETLELPTEEKEGRVVIRLRTIINEYEPYAKKVEKSEDGTSVLVADKNSDWETWVDVSEDGCEWNQFIYSTTNTKDILTKYLHDNEKICEMAFDIAREAAL